MIACTWGTRPTGLKSNTRGHRAGCSPPARHTPRAASRPSHGKRSPHGAAAAPPCWRSRCSTSTAAPASRRLLLPRWRLLSPPRPRWRRLLQAFLQHMPSALLRACAVGRAAAGAATEGDRHRGGSPTWTADSGAQPGSRCRQAEPAPESFRLCARLCDGRPPGRDSIDRN